jgi:hypothetical protein
MDEEAGDGFPLRIALGIAAIAALGYAALAVRFPRVWAALTGVIVVLASGWFTARIVFGIQRPLLVWSLAPVFGLGWLLIFWVILAVQGLV